MKPTRPTAEAIAAATEDTRRFLGRHLAGAMKSGSDNWRFGKSVRLFKHRLRMNGDGVLQPMIADAESFRPGEAAKLIQAAKSGDGDADDVLRDLAAELMRRGELPPEPLRSYAGDTLARKITPVQEKNGAVAPMFLAIT